MIGFDVLNEPWIPVIALDGTSRELGILGVLSEADRISEVACESPLETYAVQRFLIAFLMDAYRFPKAGDRKRLFESGRFDNETIMEYVELCRSEGVTFDLFDEKRPFYQAVLDEKKDCCKIKPVTYLFHSNPSGDNHIHFEHDSSKMASPSESFRALLAMQTFTAAGGRGYYRSVNGDPCWYVLLRGKNLFETLCLSMLSIRECQDLKYDSSRHIWGEVENEKQGNQFVDVSLLDGLTFRPRRITLIREDDGSIRQMYYQQGEIIDKNGRWRDPHVTYIKGKEDYEPLVPSSKRMLWRDVGAFAFSKNDGYSIPASIIRLSNNVIDKRIPRIIMLFGVALKVKGQAKYTDWLFDSMNIPGDILFEEDKADSLRMALERIEQTAALVFSTVNGVSNAAESTKDGKKKRSEAANEAEEVFFAEMHTAVFSEYFHALAEADTSSSDWEQKTNEVINGCIEEAASKTVGEFAKKLGSTAKFLEAQAKMLRFFRIELNRILYGRKGMIKWKITLKE